MSEHWKYKRGDLVRFYDNDDEIDRKVERVLPDEDNRPLYKLEQYDKPFRECDLELVVRADSSDFVEITQAEYESLQADSRKLAAVREWVQGMAKHARAYEQDIRKRSQSDEQERDLIHTEAVAITYEGILRRLQLAEVLEAGGGDE